MASSSRGPLGLWSCLKCGDYIKGSPKEIIEQIEQHMCLSQDVNGLQFDAVIELLVDEGKKSQTSPPPPPPPIWLPLSNLSVPKIPVNKGSLADQMKTIKLKTTGMLVNEGKENQTFPSTLLAPPPPILLHVPNLSVPKIPVNEGSLADQIKAIKLKSSRILGKSVGASKRKACHEISLNFEPNKQKMLSSLSSENYRVLDFLKKRQKCEPEDAEDDQFQ